MKPARGPWLSSAELGDRKPAGAKGRHPPRTEESGVPGFPQPRLPPTAPAERPAPSVQGVQGPNVPGTRGIESPGGEYKPILIFLKIYTDDGVEWDTGSVAALNLRIRTCTYFNRKKLCSKGGGSEEGREGGPRHRAPGTGAGTRLSHLPSPSTSPGSKKPENKSFGERQEDGGSSGRREGALTHFPHF